MKHLFALVLALASLCAHADVTLAPLPAESWTLMRSTTNVKGGYALKKDCYDAAGPHAESLKSSANYRCRLDLVFAVTYKAPPVVVTPPMNLPAVNTASFPAPFLGWNTKLIRPLTPNQSPNKSDSGSFREPALFTSFTQDDPIVFPGRPGVSHTHVNFGFVGISAATVSADLVSCAKGSTNGGGTLNCSAYWVPAMVDTTDGSVVRPKSMLVYYKTGYGGVDTTKIQPVPRDLKFISGNPAGNSEATASSSRFVCVGGKLGVGWQKAIPTNCYQDNLLIMEVDFPQCWDGKNLDSPDHRSHMAEADGGCPSTHPVALPKISYEVYYDLAKVDLKRMAKWRLSSDNYPSNMPGGYSAHGDYWMGWDEATMKQIVIGCVNQSIDCHSGPLNNGQELYLPDQP